MKHNFKIPYNTPAEIRCISCGKELTGGMDTFGPIREEKCQGCFLNLVVPEAAEDEFRMLLVNAELDHPSKENEYYPAAVDLVNSYPGIYFLKSDFPKAFHDDLRKEPGAVDLAEWRYAMIQSGRA